MITTPDKTKTPTDTRVLVVEDNDTMLSVLRHSLVEAGYDVTTATSGIQAIETARSENPSIIILDVMLPEMDGFEVCRILRQETTVPIIMVTARTDIEDKIQGLEVGADGYVLKPFSIRELMARIKAMLRRTEFGASQESTAHPSAVKCLKIGELEIDFTRHEVTRDKSIIYLRPREFELLALLMNNRGRVLSREQILGEIWGYDFEGDTHTVDVHIRSLRKKIENDPSHPHYIMTVWGIGYKFEEP